MSRFVTRALLCAVAFSGGLLGGGSAAAAAPGQVVVFEDHVTREPVSFTGLFPCLGAPGMQDDAAQITGYETRHITVSAAGVDTSGEPIAPLTVRATIHTRAAVDPLLEGLPTYSGFSHAVFRERVGEQGEHILAAALFKARADGFEPLTFRFLFQLVVGPDGTVRIDRTVEGCR
jgi:hypothetical protein